MNTFLTSSGAIFCALAAVGCLAILGYCIEHANAALNSAKRAEQTEVRLKVLRGDVLALQAHVGALERQLQRVAGRVYRQSNRAQLDDNDAARGLMESDDPQARRVGEVHASMGVGIAFPSPKRCQCGYCETCLNGPTKEIAP